ncbi:MAG: hypothetical protein II789_08435 [Clostridia bacterium]|nr:hypothetical protein [Clostridia bacterium]
MKKKLIVIALALVMLAATAACGININKILNRDPAIVGKWTEVRDDDFENIFRFDADNTGELKSKDNGSLVSDLEFIWKIDGSVLKIWLTEDGDPTGSNFHFKFEISKDDDGEKLEIINTDNDKTTVYRRVK